MIINKFCIYCQSQISRNLSEDDSSFLMFSCHNHDKLSIRYAEFKSNNSFDLKYIIIRFQDDNGLCYANILSSIITGKTSLKFKSVNIKLSDYFIINDLQTIINKVKYYSFLI